MSGLRDDGPTDPGDEHFELARLRDRLGTVRAQIAGYDVGDKPMSPPVRLLRDERWLMERIRMLEGR